MAFGIRNLIRAALLGCALGSATLPGSLAAQCQLCTPGKGVGAGKPTLRPITVTVETRMDFAMIGLVTRNQGGTAQIDPVTGQRILTGNLISLAGIPVTGTVLVRAEPGSHVDVTLPASAMLYNSSGGSYRLGSFTSTLKNNPKVAADGTLRFTFGALLQVTGAATGTFRGDFPITVQYK